MFIRISSVKQFDVRRENHGHYARRKTLIWSKGLSEGQALGPSLEAKGYAEGLQKGLDRVPHAYNEGFLDTYGSFTGMTPGPVEVPFSGGGGGANDKSFSPSLTFELDQ